jgi:hypothetical protein
MAAKVFAVLLALALIAAAPPASPAPAPAPTATPSASPSPSPNASAAPVPAKAGSSGVTTLPAGAHMRLHCVQVGDALFRTAEVVAAPTGPPPSIPVPSPGGIYQAAPFVPLPLAMGAGGLLLRDGLLGPGFPAWRTQVVGSGAPHHDCELDVDDGSGRFQTRYAILSALPTLIAPNPPRADGAVGVLILSHAGIRLLNF